MPITQEVNSGPKDALNRLDKDSNGSLDEDEFLMALQLLGINLNEEIHVKLLHKYCQDESKLIHFPHFKKAWLVLGRS